MKPKLLFFAAYFPPAPTVASVRAWNMARYLARSGWDVTVVTPHPRLLRRKDDPERIERELARDGIRRIHVEFPWSVFWYTNFPDQGWWRPIYLIFRRLGREIGFDSEKAWFAAAEKACAHLTPDDVDVVMATGGPFGIFATAERVAKRLGRPYVLDYRDSWTDNPIVRFIRFTPAIINEQARLLRDAAAITTVSPSLAELLVQRGAREPVHVVANGYDPELLAGAKPKDFGHFTIVYTGTIYSPGIVIDPLFAALRRLDERGIGGPHWRFHYYGSYRFHIARAAKEHGIEHRVVQHGLVPQREALDAIAGANVAVVITSVADEANLREKAIVTGKIFEPLGLHRPVLLIAPPACDVEKVVERTGLATRFVASDTEGIAAFLARLMDGGEGAPLREPEAYAWSNLVKSLDGILRGVSRR